VQIVLVYTPAISAQFTFNMCATARNCEKTLKQLRLFGGLMVIQDVDILMKLLIRACYDKQHISA